MLGPEVPYNVYLTLPLGTKLISCLHLHRTFGIGYREGNVEREIFNFLISGHVEIATWDCGPMRTPTEKGFDSLCMLSFDRIIPYIGSDIYINRPLQFFTHKREY